MAIFNTCVFLQIERSTISKVYTTIMQAILMLLLYKAFEGLRGNNVSRFGTIKMR